MYTLRVMGVLRVLLLVADASSVEMRGNSEVVEYHLCPSDVVSVVTLDFSTATVRSLNNADTAN